MDNWLLLGIGINIVMLLITVVVTVTSLRKIIEITRNVEKAAEKLIIKAKPCFDRLSTNG